jgi:hypothetical protein
LEEVERKRDRRQKRTSSHIVVWGGKEGAPRPISCYRSAWAASGLLDGRRKRTWPPSLHQDSGVIRDEGCLSVF